jgi:hyperosmotically inducible protein
MLKRMSVLFCGVAMAVLTAGYAAAQSATQDAKDKTHAAANKTGQVASDAEITSSVKSKLLASKQVSGLKLDVDTNDGVVTLSGVAASAAERTEAARLARTAHGVKSVKNNITLDTTATSGHTKADDKDLKIVVKDDTKETGEKIKDATKKGAEKTADGAKKVGSATKHGAEKTVDAVKDTKVVVKDDTTPKLEKAGDKTADAAITSAVKTKFLGDTQVSGMKIDVDTKDGVVTLTGNVKSEAEKAEAVRLAKNTTGVKSVVDKLTVVR